MSAAPLVVGSAEQLRGLLGHPVGPTEWLTITQQRVDAFAEATGDRQWIHVDPERVAAAGLASTIAHGYLTLALIPFFAAQLVSIDFGSARLNYGTEQVRFPAPVPTGSRVRGSVVTRRLEQRASGLLLTATYTVEVEGNQRPACEAHTLVLIRP